ncbi:MAG: DEAD/DEAH box helicase [Desulfobacteraceae bacterium]|jgi:ATP-dependent RNA helicase RhlB|nr:MAG: DEAD/DEAH box helicase [Desulfobacteraceae bacterium]
MSEDIINQQSPERPEQPKFLTNTRFEDLYLPSEILQGLKDSGLFYCTPIQSEVLPIALAGKDVAGQAKTGTGKTAAFLIPLFCRLMSIEEKTPGIPSALIVAPTRELAMQVLQDAMAIGRHTGFKMIQVVGGIDYAKQAEMLRAGADIVIGTPGRMIDYIKKGVLKTAGIKVLVIDEADRLFDLGFTKDMLFILRKLPHYEKRLSMLFSATLSYRVLALTYDYMNLPEFISTIPEEVTVEDIEQCLFHVASEEKLPLLLGLLDRKEWSRVLIFVNTKVGVNYVAGRLKANGIAAEGITGDLPQTTRIKLMKGFKEGRIKILVATDVASRGIHVEDISHVVNYDLPQDSENYIHRIGRTARAGKKGVAISFASEDDVYFLEPIETRLGHKIPVVWPQEDWFKADQGGTPAKEYRGSRDKRRQRGPKPLSPEREEKPSVETGMADSSSPDRQRDDRTGRGRGRQFHSWMEARGIGFSSQPGGVFGLAVNRRQTQAQETTKPEKKKRRRRKKPVSLPESLVHETSQP